MENQRSPNRNTVPGLREIDLATVRAQYVREHKIGAVNGDHMAETQFQVRHMKISKPRPLPVSKNPKSPPQRTHSKLHKPRPPPPMASSSQRDPHQPPPMLPPLVLGDVQDPEPTFSISPHLDAHLDLDQVDEALTSFRDRRAGVVLQLGRSSSLRQTSPGDLARSLFEARIARRKSYLGHPDYYIPRSVKTRASVVSQAPSTARLNALEASSSPPPLFDIQTHPSTSATSLADATAGDVNVAHESHLPVNHLSVYFNRPNRPRPVSDIVKNRNPRSRILSLLNPISRTPRRVLVEEVEDEGTPPVPNTSLPMTSPLESPTREASTIPLDPVVAATSSLQTSDSNVPHSLKRMSTNRRGTGVYDSDTDSEGNDDSPRRVPTSLPVPPTGNDWRASRGTRSPARMSTVIEEEPSSLPPSTHLPSAHSASTASLDNSVFTANEEPSGDDPDTSGTSLSAHARTPLKAAENLPSTSRGHSREHSLAHSLAHSEKPLPTVPAQAGVSGGPSSSAERMYSRPAGGVTAARPWEPEVAGGRKLVRKRAQHALHLETDSDEDLRTFRLQLAARPPDEPAGWYRRDADKPPLSVTSFGSLLGVRFRNDCRIDFGHDGQSGEGPISPTIYEYIS